MNYRNRIIGLEYVHAQELESHPGNWRNHGKAQTDVLKGVLAEVGIADALLAYRSERNGNKLTLIDGHLRKGAANQQWPVLILDVDDAEADYILATHDPLTAMADADAAAVDALMSSVSSGNESVAAMLEQMRIENELTSLEDNNASGTNERNIGKDKHAVKTVLFLEQIKIFEDAIIMTGLKNRGRALTAICEFYIENYEKRQLDSIFESFAEKEHLARD